MIAVSFFFSLFSPITVSEEKARESIAAHKTSLHLSALPTKAGLRFILMPAEQFKSTLTRACRCKLLNCSGARFFAILRKTLHFKKNHILILFKIRRQSMDTDGQNKGFDP